MKGKRISLDQTQHWRITSQLYAQYIIQFVQNNADLEITSGMIASSLGNVIYLSQVQADYQQQIPNLTNEISKIDYSSIESLDVKEINWSLSIARTLISELSILLSTTFNKKVLMYFFAGICADGCIRYSTKLFPDILTFKVSK